MRRNKGFIDVSKMLHDIGVNYTDISSLKCNAKIIDVAINYETDLVFGFDYYGTTYFFKYDEDIEPYNELVAEELAKDFGLDCIDYDLAILNDKKGVISKNYKQNGVNYIDGEDIIIDYYEASGLDIEKQNNLESVWDALEYRYKNLPNKREVIQKLMDKLVNIFIFDIITCQSDRHPCNWQVMESKDDIDVVPLFDNERIGISYNKYVFCSLTSTEEVCGDLFENLASFLKMSSKDYRDITLEKISIISDENLYKVFNRIEDKTGCPMPQDKKEFYLANFRNHRNKLQEILKMSENILERDELDERKSR